jgi:hypothetical protein
MPTGTTESVSDQRERALQRARRRLRWLEIETHRIKAELARLEAAFEDDLADRLTVKLRRLRGRRARLRFDGGHSGSSTGHFESESPFAEEAQACDRHQTLPSRRPAVLVTPYARPFLSDATLTSERATVSIDPKANIRVEPLAKTSSTRRRARQSRALLLSAAFHVLSFCILLPWTVATIAQQQPPLMSITVDWLDDSLREIDEVKFTAPALEDDLPAHLALDSPREQSAEPLLSNFLPTEQAGSSDFIAGLSDTAILSPAINGDLMNLGPPGGLRGSGQGTRGEPLGFASFFGARTQGDRIVFIVDNSSSMKDGRLEAALAELLRSVDALGRRQSFYVVFVADQVYPMFYPDRAPELVLATPENKRRLADWLGKVQLAGGNNRELIKAMDLAAEMRPHAVYLLWDGDLRYSEAVRRDVMTHLTRPQPWEFSIHTLGMGTLSADSEQNLFAIAQAHRGAYKRIDVPKPAGKK